MCESTQDEPARDGSIWVGVGVLVIAAGGALATFCSQGEQAIAEREAFRQPLPISFEVPPAEAAEPRPRPTTVPAPAYTAVAPVTFGNGTVARVVEVRRAEPHEARTSHANGDDAQNFITVAIEFDDALPPDDRDHVLRIDGRRIERFGRAPRAAQPDRVRGDAAARLSVTTAVEADADRIAIEVGAACGPYVEAQRFAFGDVAAPVSPGDPPQPMRIVRLLRRPAAVVLELDDHRDLPAFADQAWLLQGVRKDGTRVAAGSSSRGSQTGHLVAIPVPPAELDHVDYRSCPYEWRTIGEVALPPRPAATELPPTTASAQ